MNEYRVERINHFQRHLYPDLFNHYRFCQRETSQEKSVANCMVKRLFKSEPVLFIALRNYPETIPVGFIQLYSMSSSINDVQTTVVSDLYVLPESRKNGIALKLIEAAVKFAINNRSGLIELETLHDNLIARKLFESVGFKSQTSESEVNHYSIQFEYD